MANRADDEHNETIIKLLLEKQEQEDTIATLKQQRIELKGEINKKVVKLEIAWRKLLYRSIAAQIEYLRYRQKRLNKLRIKHEQIKTTGQTTDQTTSSDSSSEVSSVTDDQ